MTKTLKQKTFSGLGWSAVDKFIQQLFVFISGILLARILGKEVYGLIGVLSVFIGIATLIQDNGFSTALVRKQQATQADYTTMFYTNISIGTIIYIILFFSAPLISRYYEQPILTWLSRFLFLSFFFNSFSIIQYTKLLKDINYKLLAKINSISAILSYLTALILAYNEYGVWALASQTVMMALTKLVLFWTLSEWRPSGKFSIETFKEFFSFGSKLMLGGILNSFSTNIPQNIIAKQYGLGITGLYNQASRLHNTIYDFLAGTVQSIPFTVLSKIEDNDELRKAYRKFIRVKAFVTFPVFLGLALIAHSFVYALLGKQWIDAVPILQLLCIGGLFLVMDNSNGDILKIKGKSGTLLWLDILRNILIFFVIAIVLTFKLDYIYLVAGLSLTYITKYIIGLCVVNKIITYPLSDLLKDVLPYFAVAGLALTFGYYLSYFIEHQLALMICQIIGVGILYIGILYLMKSVIVRETFTVIKSSIFGRNTDS